MSKRVAEIMGQPEYLVKRLINKLEDKNGSPGYDALHLAENIQKVRTKLIDLGLDPDDTTGEELYQALLAKFENDAKLFDGYFSTVGQGFDQKAAKTIQILASIDVLPRQWALKRVVAKSVLRAQPPKRVMKQLNYRSAESMLKRENLDEIYLAAAYAESVSWNKLHIRLVSKLNQTDFELRPVKLQHLDYARWANISGPQDFIAVNNEVAAIGLWPSHEIRETPLLSMVLLMLEKLGDYQEINIGKSLARMSNVVTWWKDMDQLVANLAGEHVSLSIKDSCLNSLQNISYEERTLEHGRANFWRALASRYENQLPDESLFDGSVLQKVIGLKLAVPQPAYEEVENL